MQPFWDKPAAKSRETGADNAPGGFSENQAGAQGLCPPHVQIRIVEETAAAGRESLFIGQRLKQSGIFADIRFQC
jgi:hypothetical protein